MTLNSFMIQFKQDIKNNIIKDVVSDDDVINGIQANIDNIINTIVKNKNISLLF